MSGERVADTAAYIAELRERLSAAEEKRDDLKEALVARNDRCLELERRLVNLRSRVRGALEE